jgi:beta-lactamase superfamily II metal-dependent hydrolase
MSIDYVSELSLPVYPEASTQSKARAHLLWGDRVVVGAVSGEFKQITARGLKGPCFVKTAGLGGQSLLEFYFIDVGQGDGVLIRTPDHRHVLVDGGYKRASQPTGKNAADFVDWKFAKDYGSDTIALDAVVVSHCDADHYGGVWDLFSRDERTRNELDTKHLTVERIFHAGLSWWKSTGSDGKTLGPHAHDTSGQSCYTQLLDDRSTVNAATNLTEVGPKLKGEWLDLWRAALAINSRDGVPTPIQRISHNTGDLPGFEAQPGGVNIRVLGPIESSVADQPALQKYTGGDSKNTNGHSVLLRVDYGRTRVLLTGDLNRVSQGALLREYIGRRQELEADVAKACHHGSDDVSYEFLQAIRPAVTVISSGDAEGHDHPRAAILAASATTGYLKVEDDAIKSPLVYCTEIARSLNVGKISKLTRTGSDHHTMWEVLREDMHSVTAEVKVTKAGALNPETKKRRLDYAPLVADLVYGLVNVRTDGDRIVCATRNEADGTWNVKEVRSRF